jgi:RNA polymerase sigma-70 factor (ECF subfamily)
MLVSKAVPLERDIELLAAARKMDGHALLKIFDLYASALYNYSFRLCNNAVMADQIVGDVFAKLMEQFSTGRGPHTNLRSYLYEMAYHLVVDEARYSHRRAPIEEVDVTNTNKHFTAVSADERLLVEAVFQAIMNDLTDEQRHVIILRFVEGFSTKETAAITGKKVGTVTAIQYRAMAALRKAFVSQ